MPASPQFGKERRLESWGEIASYLRREIRTVQRLEKTLGLPIHRLRVGKNSSVYAYPSELDKWYLEREPKNLKTTNPQENPRHPNRFTNPKPSWAPGLPALWALAASRWSR